MGTYLAGPAAPRWTPTALVEGLAAPRPAGDRGSDARLRRRRPAGPAGRGRRGRRRHRARSASERDPLFGGHPPEPLAPYLERADRRGARQATAAGRPAVGIVFDGDGDRIAAVDEQGRFCSTQLLMPLLIDHLARARRLGGSVVKTVSGSDLMALVAADLGREVIEMPVGFKYIAAEMLSGEVLVGGEESGGVGFGIHLPERDALFAALLLIEALVEGGLPLGARLAALQERCGGASVYDRLDLRLPDMASRGRLEALLAEDPPQEVAGAAGAGGEPHRWGQAADGSQPLADAALLGHRTAAAALLRGARRGTGADGAGTGRASWRRASDGDRPRRAAVLAHRARDRQRQRRQDQGVRPPAGLPAPGGAAPARRPRGGGNRHQLRRQRPPQGRSGGQGHGPAGPSPTTPAWRGGPRRCAGSAFGPLRGQRRGQDRPVAAGTGGRAGGAAEGAAIAGQRSWPPWRWPIPPAPYGWRWRASARG